ncbi:hypothetical protein PWP93_28425, partial [Paraburkholderia sp. A1RI-2L]
GLSSKLDGGVAEYEFDAQFELHPTREPYRMPQVTPRPRIEGYENAVIVGWEQHPIMGDHATDDPQARPVDFPVTPDNPGKYAAHHVLVEDGGGFAVANQPYRLTLDDGQIIEGVTSELGELQMVTSNTISFGVVELMSQSSPDDVIGVTHVTVYDDGSRPVTPPSEPPAKRTTAIGGKSASTPDENVTSQAKQPEYFTCDALNFGLRRYRLLKGATTEDTPLKYQRRDNIEYPVAKTYTAAIKTALEAIDWVGLDKGPSNVFYETIVSAIQPSLWAALQDGPFGLRAGSEERYGAMPEVVIVGPEGYPKYGMKADYAGGFVSEYWTIAINTTRMDRIVSYAKPLDDKSLTGEMTWQKSACTGCWYSTTTGGFLEKQRRPIRSLHRS